MPKNLTEIVVPSLLAASILLCGGSARADALSELAAFSAFKDLKSEALADGTVKTARGPAMSFPRGLAVESCYVVRKTQVKTAELLQQWTPAKHPELKVLLHGDLPSRPGPGNFDQLATAPANSAVKSFVAATRKLPSDRTELQMSDTEAKTFPGDSSRGGGMSPAVASFWSKVLSQRAQDFVAGGLSRLPAYEMGKETIRASEEASRLLKGAGKIRTQFASLLKATPLAGGSGSLKPGLYWEMINVEGEAAVTLGASYQQRGATTSQSVDAQYYASNGFYLLLTFHQMWPVSIGGQEATLVWRGDLISAASLGTLHGVERMGSSTAMMRETKKSIGAFLSDIAKTR